MDPRLADYRASHVRPGCGADYVSIYEKGYYAGLWRDVERPLVNSILARFGGPSRSCLDFACGTGRLTEVAALHFGDVVGVDVSSAMLTAAKVPSNVTLLNRDITTDALGREFDVALAFRFFLNADEQLRHEVLAALNAHLKVGGMLVANIHMSASSPMGFAYGLLDWLAGKEAHRRVSKRELVKWVSAHGFEVVEVVSYGFLPRPGPLFSSLAERLVLPVEKAAKYLRVSTSLAQSFLVIAKRTG